MWALFQAKRLPTSLTLRAVVNNRGGEWLPGWLTVVQGSTQDGASPQPTRSHGEVEGSGLPEQDLDSSRRWVAAGREEMEELK